MPSAIQKAGFPKDLPKLPPTPPLLPAPPKPPPPQTPRPPPQTTPLSPPNPLPPTPPNPIPTPPRPPATPAFPNPPLPPPPPALSRKRCLPPPLFPPPSSIPLAFPPPFSCGRDVTVQSWGKEDLVGKKGNRFQKGERATPQGEKGDRKKGGEPHCLEKGFDCSPWGNPEYNIGRQGGKALDLQWGEKRVSLLRKPRGPTPPFGYKKVECPLV